MTIFFQIKWIDKEYYFLKAGLLEQQSAVVSIFQKYAR